MSSTPMSATNCSAQSSALEGRGRPLPRLLSSEEEEIQVSLHRQGLVQRSLGTPPIQS